MKPSAEKKVTAAARLERVVGKDIALEARVTFDGINGRDVVEIPLPDDEAGFKMVIIPLSQLKKAIESYVSPIPSHVFYRVGEKVYELRPTQVDRFLQKHQDAIKC